MSPAENAKMAHGEFAPPVLADAAVDFTIDKSISWKHHGDGNPRSQPWRGSDEVAPDSALRERPFIVKPPKSAEPQYEDFLGMTAVLASPAMRRVMTLAGRVGRSSAPVLITGESGTGKELVARAVHKFSVRALKPFIDINCAALPEHLMESELFGYGKRRFQRRGQPEARPL